MRSIATLNLELGLMSIPLKVVSLGSGSGISFNLTCKTHKKPIKMKRFCEDCGKEIPYNELGRSIKIGDKRYMIEDEFYDVLKDVDKKIEVLDVVSSEELEELGFGVDLSLITEKHYGILPKESFEKQYCLLQNLLNLSGKKLLVRYALRTKSHLGLMKVFGKHLYLAQLVYPEYSRKLPDYDMKELNKQELKLGVQLLEKLEKDKPITEYKDQYKEKVQNYITGDLKIEKKQAKQKTQDMVELLNASLQEEVKKDIGEKKKKKGAKKKKKLKA